MANSLAPAEPYTWSFEATVESLDDRDVVLDRTYFYPQGGGQPADRGLVGGTGVEDVQERGGAVVHVLKESIDVSVGDVVSAQVDPAFRTYCMRAHTASHVLYGAGRRLLDDLGYGGFGITDEKVRVDFSTPTSVDDETLVELERLVNRTVWDSKSVTWETYPEEEALGMDDIAFNVKTEEGLTGDHVRVVTVEDWDVAACGGTHVANTREIGPVTVLDRSNPGEGLTRIEIAVGPSGIEQRIAEKQALLDAASVAGTAPDELPGEIERLQDQVASLEDEVGSLQDRVAATQLAELGESAMERDGATWLVGAIDGLDSDTLGDRARDLAGEEADVVALVGRDGQTFITVAASGPDASAVVDAVTGEFGGGGGGSERFAQGGGIQADPADVVDFLRQ